MSSERTSHESATAGAAAHSQQLPVRAIGTVGRAIAALAVLAGVWTLLQIWNARQTVNADQLWSPAAIVYVAGLGYLAFTAATAWRAGQFERGSPSSSLVTVIVLGTAQAIVIAVALAVASRGTEARGLLVGLGESLVAWGVVALLAGALELAAWLVGRLPADRMESAAAGSPGRRNLASACLICATALGSGLVYLETRPLPNMAPPDATKESSAGDDAGVARQVDEPLLDHEG